MDCATCRWLLLTVIAMLLVLCAIDTVDMVAALRMPVDPFIQHGGR